MKEGRRRTILYSVFIVAATVFVLLLLARQTSALDQMLQSTRSFGWRLHPLLLGGSVLLGTANLLLMASVWAGLFRSGGGSAERTDAARVWLVTNFGRYIPGKVWQLGGLAVYMRGRGDSGAAALLSAVVFQIVTIVTGTGVAVAALGVRWLGARTAWLPGIAALCLILAVGLHPRALRWMATRLARWMGEGEVRGDIRPAGIVRATAGMLVAWALYGLGLLLLLRGVGVAWETHALSTLTGVFAASYVAGYLVLLAPGGLVVREGAMTALLVETGGLALGVAATLSVIARLWAVTTELAALFLAVSWLGRGRRLRG